MLRMINLCFVFVHIFCSQGPPSFLFVCIKSQFMVSMHSWDVPDETDSDSSGDPYDVTPEQGGEEFTAFLLSLHLTGRMSAKSCCVLAWWATRAGAVGPADSLSSRPDSATGHFQRKIDSFTKVDSKSKHLYYLETPLYQKFEASRTSYPMPTFPPHERIYKEYLENPSMTQDLHTVSEAWQTDAYKDESMKDDRPLLPCVLYMDGVVFAKRDSTLGIWIYNALTKVRHLLVNLRKSEMCKCGCKGWCTIWVVLEFLRWSLEHLRLGKCPPTRHDGSEFHADTDAVRSLDEGENMEVRGLVVWVKGDWAEFSHTLGFPTWAHNTNPCIFCSCLKDQMFRFRGCNPLNFPFQLRNTAAYNLACNVCERFVEVISEDTRKLLLANLRYDRRSSNKASSGRAWTKDLPILGLCRGDRLEPCPNLRDVSSLKNVPLPVRLTFWRVGLETKSKHRNPLFDKSTGISVNSLAIDILHKLHLGVFKFWVQLVFWLFIDCNFCGAEGTAEEKIMQM